MQFAGRRQRQRAFGAQFAAPFLQAELVRHQFLEGQPLLRRMPARHQEHAVGIARRRMHIAQRRGQRPAARLGRRQPVRQVVGCHARERLRHQRPQAQLRQAFGHRVNRRQRVGGRRHVGRHGAVFRVVHLDAGRAHARLAENAQSRAALEFFFL